MCSDNKILNLMEQGFSQIAKGGFACVYRNKKIIAKFPHKEQSIDPDNFFIFAQYAKENPCALFPEIYSIEGKDGFDYLIHMEFIDYGFDESTVKNYKQLDKIFEYIKDEYEIPSFAKKYLRKEDLEALEKLVEYGNNLNIGWDLYPCNIRVTKNGQIKIIDPWY